MLYEVSLQWAHRYAKPASERISCGRTRSCCKIKKAACSFNKGVFSSGTVGSKEVSEALEKLTNTVSLLVDKVDRLMGEVVILQGHVGDMCHNYNSGTEDPDSPEELMSEAGLEGWQASCTEVKDLKGVNSEALQQVMQWRLDEDMAQLQAQEMPETEKLNASDPYEISNRECWYGLGGPEMMVQMKVKRDYFQATRNEFYKLGGHQSQWQIWKAHLQKNNCEEFMVEDSDPVEEVMGGKWRKAWKPYGDDLGIPALDNLFVMESDSTGDSSDDEEDGDEDEHSESREDEAFVPVGTGDVEMEVVDAEA